VFLAMQTEQDHSSIRLTCENLLSGRSFCGYKAVMLASVCAKKGIVMNSIDLRA